MLFDGRIIDLGRRKIAAVFVKSLLQNNSLIEEKVGSIGKER